MRNLGDTQRLNAQIWQEGNEQLTISPGLAGSCSIVASLACPWALTLVNVITAKVGSIGVVGQEMLQEGGEVVAMPQYQMGTEHVLVHEAQVEVIAEGVHMHQITDLVTLLCEQQGQLGRKSRRQGYDVGSQAAQAVSLSSWTERKLGTASCCCGPSRAPSASTGSMGNLPLTLCVIWRWASCLIGTGPFGTCIRI